MNSGGRTPSFHQNAGAADEAEEKVEAEGEGGQTEESSAEQLQDYVEGEAS